MNKKIIFLVVGIFLIVSIGCIYFLRKNTELSLNNNENLERESENMNELKIKMDINGVSFTVTLIDNETSRELIDRLPISIIMNELNGNEKYYYFNETLSSSPNHIGEIHVGDLMLYGNDCLVLFYDDFATNYRYTKIGSIDHPNNLKDIVGSGNIKISFTR